jgi:hypothetical protein
MKFVSPWVAYLSASGNAEGDVWWDAEGKPYVVIPVEEAA